MRTDVRRILPQASSDPALVGNVLLTQSEDIIAAGLLRGSLIEGVCRGGHCRHSKCGEQKWQYFHDEPLFPVCYINKDEGFRFNVPL